MPKSLEYSIRIDGVQQSIEDVETLAQTIDSLDDKLTTASEILSDSFGVAKQYAAFLSLAFS